MQTAPTLAGLQTPAFIFDQKAIKQGQEMRDILYDMNVEMQASLKIPTIWEKRWKSGLEIVIDDTKRWWNVFANVNKDIRNEWADTINVLISEGGNFKDFMEDMFNSVLTSFNKFVAQVLASDLWYTMFGQGLPLPFGAATLFHKGKVEAAPGYTAIPQWEPIRPTPPVFDPTRQLGQFAGKAAIPSVIINNNTGTPMSASKPVFNGKEFIVNVVMEEYNTNPNFRNALKE